MKNILVPTDFSKTAEHALEFAAELAKKENAKLILLHVYDINFTNGYVSSDILTEDLTELEAKSQMGLNALNAIIEKIGDIEHESVIVQGDAIDGILKIIHENDIDLVVMGTRGASGLKGAIFGSNTAQVIEKATCPVIAIPEGVLYKTIKKITYATCYLKSDIEGIKKVVEIAEPYNAQINVLHITNENESPKVATADMKAFMEKVNDKIGYSNISFQLLEGASVEKTLEKYVNDNSTCMLVMSTHYRDFFDKIFGKSITQQVAYHIQIPLMTLHHR